jgi:hypothetical protein
MKHVIIGVVMLGLGIVTGVHGKGILDEARASTKWPAVPGRVTESHLTTSHDRHGTTYGAHVEYTYTVEGREHRGSTVWFGEDRTSDRSAAQKTLALFPTGKEVRVFYQPDEPDTSVLEPGTYPSSYVVLAGGLIFALVGVGMLIRPVSKLVVIVAMVLKDRREQAGSGV